MRKLCSLVVLLLLCAPVVYAQSAVANPAVFSRVRIGDGTVSIPSLAFDADTNTGLYRIGADNIGLATGGALRLDVNTSRVSFALPPAPNANMTIDSGSNALKWKDTYSKKFILGDDATQANNVMLRHMSGTDATSLLTIAKGDESALTSAQMLKLSIQGDTSFPDGRVLDSQPNWTSGDSSVGAYAFYLPSGWTPTADFTHTLVGMYTNAVFNGTHSDSQYITGFQGEAYWNSTGNANGGLTGISAWNGGSPASGTATLANNNPLYAGGASNTHVSSTIFNTLYVDRAYSDGGGAIGEMQMIYIEDPAGYVSDGGTISGATYIIKSNLSNGRFNVNGDGTAKLTGLQLDRNGVSKPTCNSAARGEFWYTAAGAGVKDNVEVCAKDAGDAYAWRTIY